MQFVFPALTGAFLLALLPLLIHVINLVRHQRVEWAAMEFLLASYKKHRRWVWLKQFLLMLARIAVVALIVLMCAQWKTEDQSLSIFGGKSTHHYVVLDDSYSMSQRVGGATAFDDAKRVLLTLATEAAEQDSEHKITVLRMSQALAGEVDSAGTAKYAERADFNAETIDKELLERLEKARQRWEPTELATTSRNALASIRQLVDPAASEHRVVYLLSDFRKREWDDPTELREILSDLEKGKCDLQFVDCSRPEEPNLGIVDISAESDTKAAGVPMFVAFQVKNHGREPVRRAQVKIRSLFYPPMPSGAAEPGQWKPVAEELPAVLIEQINPGEVVSRRTQVFYPQAGRHVLEITLPEDSIAADNHRRLVIDCPDGEQALVIDGSDDQQNAYFLAAAFHPLQRSNTGVKADVKPATFLREATAETLRSYTSVYLLDVPRLDQRALGNLQKFVQEGGGLGIFVGDQTNIAYYNDKLFAEGQGLLPLPLGAPVELAPSSDDDSPDFVVENHPVFSFFRGERNSFLSGVSILRYMPPRSNWTKEPKSGIEYLATIRGGKPLFAEKGYGEGRVVLGLTTLAPQWNDWGKNPSFVVMALKLQSYLAAAARPDVKRLVGEPLKIELEAARFLPEVTFVSPGASSDVPTTIRVTAKTLEQGSPLLVASLAASSTERAGLYEAWTTNLQGTPDVRRLALNVDPTEGEMATVAPTQLALALDPLKPDIQKAGQVSYLASGQSSYNRSLLAMALLVGLMLGEQALAYSASYHPVRGGLRL